MRLLPHCASRPTAGLWRRGCWPTGRASRACACRATVTAWSSGAFTRSMTCPPMSASLRCASSDKIVYTTINQNCTNSKFYLQSMTKVRYSVEKINTLKTGIGNFDITTQQISKCLNAHGDACTWQCRGAAEVLCGLMARIKKCHCPRSQAHDARGVCASNVWHCSTSFWQEERFALVTARPCANPQA
jgi:hypothetical protein